MTGGAQAVGRVVVALGAQLRQDALAATYEVSRIPVREALFQLEAEGLVRTISVFRVT